jgi:hypothetical protein
MAQHHARFDATIFLLVTNQGVVELDEFKKNYRAKHAKLAKASPIPPFLSNSNLASFAFFAQGTSFPNV